MLSGRVELANNRNLTSMLPRNDSKRSDLDRRLDVRNVHQRNVAADTVHRPRYRRRTVIPSLPHHPALLQCPPLRHRDTQTMSGDVHTRKRGTSYALVRVDDTDESILYIPFPNDTPATPWYIGVSGPTGWGNEYM